MAGSVELTLGELLQGKGTIIKNKEFFPTRNYVEPFINKMSKYTDDFRVEVRLPQQITKVADTADLTYNRVWVQAVLPEKYCIDNHDEVIGFLYGIDTKKPLCKIYKGMLNRACTNLTVFNPDWQSCQELLPGEILDYKPIDRVMSMEDDFAKSIAKLKNTTLNRENQIHNLGLWVDKSLRMSGDDGFGKINLSNTFVIDAYKKLFVNPDSEYFIPQGIDPTMFTIYNAFTQIITDDSKDMINKFTKTILISKLLGINE